MSREERQRLRIANGLGKYLVVWRNLLTRAIGKKARFGMDFADVIAEIGRYI